MALSKVVHSSKSQEYRTPKHLYNKLNKEFNFELDPCTTEDNPLGTKYYYTEEGAGPGINMVCGMLLRRMIPNPKNLNFISFINGLDSKQQHTRE